MTTHGTWYLHPVPTEFKPTVWGRLMLIESDSGQEFRVKNSGAPQVLIVQEN